MKSEIKVDHLTIMIEILMMVQAKKSAYTPRLQTNTLNW